MKLASFLLAAMLGATFSCANHDLSPCVTITPTRIEFIDTAEPEGPRVMPAHAEPFYSLYVDEEVPLDMIIKAANDWEHVQPRVHFYIHKVSHEQAVRRTREILDARTSTPGIVYLTLDEKAGAECGDDPKFLACYAWPGVIWFEAPRIEAWHFWDRVPAHELGHAMGLEHVEETVQSIMRPFVSYDIGEPNYFDGQRLNFDLKQ